MPNADVSNLNLSNAGINEWKTIYHNLSYEELFEHETNPALEGYEKGIVSELGAVAVDTGKFTGRSPKDKYIVEDETSQDSVWWLQEVPEAPITNVYQRKPGRILKTLRLSN